MGKKFKAKKIDDVTAEAMYQEWKKGQGPILIKKSEAARLLGFGIRWLEGQIKEGAPCVRMGRSVRMRRSDVEAFARNGQWPGAELTQAEIDYILAHGGKLPKGMTVEELIRRGGKTFGLIDKKGTQQP